MEVFRSVGPVATSTLSLPVRYMRVAATGWGRTARKPRSQPGGTRHTRARVTRDATVIVSPTLPPAALREDCSPQHPAGRSLGKLRHLDA